jgi:uncharacterized protein
MLLSRRQLLPPIRLWRVHAGGGSPHGRAPPRPTYDRGLALLPESLTMTSFTPIPAALGGALIGLAAVLLLWLTGRIAGISGIAGGLLKGDRAWRAAFLVGLVAGAAGLAWLGGPVAAPREGMSPLLLVAAGLLTGYGTSLAHGCTSGHGVCGLARLSLRSLVAVVVFLGSAIAMVALLRHGPFAA